MSTVVPVGLGSHMVPISDSSDGKSHPAVNAVYVFGDKLGRGCFATVYKAMRRSDDFPVAIKVVKKAHLDSDSASMLQNELEVLRAVSEHPGIVTLLDHVETESHMYFIMEYIGGGQLLDRIVARGSFSENDARIILRTTLLTLDFLAELGCVHRDIKPENILVDNHSEGWPVKLTDFGLSVKMQPDELLYGTLGTPLFVAPEILKGEGYDSSCDVWSLGVVLYLILCGYPPFPYETPDRLIASIYSGNYSFPPREWDRVSADAKDAVRRMMQVDPKLRITPKEALAHTWFKAVQSTLDLPNRELRSFNARRKMKATMLAVRTTFGLMRIIKPKNSSSCVTLAPNNLLEDVEKSRAIIDAMRNKEREPSLIDCGTRRSHTKLELSRSESSLLVSDAVHELCEDSQEPQEEASTRRTRQALRSTLGLTDSAPWSSQIMQSKARAMVAEVRDCQCIQDYSNPFFTSAADEARGEKPFGMQELDFKSLK